VWRGDAVALSLFTQWAITIFSPRIVLRVTFSPAFIVLVTHAALKMDIFFFGA